jgi:hypothetical protein
MGGYIVRLPMTAVLALFSLPAILSLFYGYQPFRTFFALSSLCKVMIYDL